MRVGILGFRKQRIMALV